MDESRFPGIPLFSRLTRPQRKMLAEHAREIEVPAGEHLVDEGEFAHEFFVIEEGKAAVVAEGKHLTELGPGDFLGEIGLMKARNRTASVIASTPIKAVVLDEDGFRTMTRSMPMIMREIDAAIDERLRRDAFFGIARD